MTAAKNGPRSVPDFSGMTKAQLLAYAEETGAEGVSERMTKAKIIEALEG